MAAVSDSTFAAGGGHTAVIRPDGTLWVAGSNNSGQLGDGGPDRNVASNAANDVAAVFAGNANTFWIKSDRTLWATGSGQEGMLGDGGLGKRYIPIQVATNVSTVAVGGGHMAFVKVDGTLWTTGRSVDGQLGRDTVWPGNVPLQTADGVSAVAAGLSHTIFLKTDGALWGTGDNRYGQLGDGTATYRTTPGQITTNVMAIAAGRNSSYFIRTDGTLWAMGANDEGQLGDGTDDSRGAPVLIASGVKDVKAGESHAVFLKTDNTLWAMGYNGDCQIGAPFTTSRFVPVQIASSVIEFAADSDTTFYRKSDQSVWCSGENDYGAFGLGFNGDAFQCPMAGPPIITFNPIGYSVDPGMSVSFPVTVIGPGPFTYQWRKDNQPIPGATSDDYEFYAAEDKQGEYTVEVTGRDGSVVTAPALLAVKDPPSIDVHPAPALAMPGKPAVFSVQASGPGVLTYQWRKSNINISGARSATFSISSVTADDAGSYSCVVTNYLGSTLSNSAALTVGPLITAHPQSRTATAGTSQQFSVAALGTALTYQWRHGQVPIFGANSSTYTFTGSKLSEGSYDVVISNAAGSVTSNPVSFVVIEPIGFILQPRGATLPVGAPLHLEVIVGGTGPFSYQWNKGGIPIPYATKSSLDITAITGSHAGVYTCTVTNSAGYSVSSPAPVLVGPEILVAPSGGTLNPGGKHIFSVQVSGSGTFTYAWRRNGVTVASSPSLVIDGATEGDEGSYSVQVTTEYGTVQSGTVQLWVNDAPKIKTHPLSVQANPGLTASFSVEMQGTGNFTYQWRYNGSPIAGATRSVYTIEGIDESHIGSYDVVVTATTGSVTSAAASLDLDLRPTVTRHPTSRAVRIGATLNLDVEAAGDGPLTYQWYRNGAQIAGATSAAFQLSNIQPELEGNYTVEIGNPAGFVMSAPAVISLSEWTEVTGIYQALFTSEDSAGDENPWRGRITMTVTARGSFSGRLEFEGFTHRLTGTFGKDLTFSTIIKRSGGAYLRLGLRLSPNEDGAQLDAEVGPEGLQAAAHLSAARNMHHKRLNPALQAGRYVMAIEKSPDSAGSLLPPGYAVIRISATGAVNLTGKMPDGAKLTSGGYIDEDGAFSFYQCLYRPTLAEAGVLAGPVIFSPIASDQAVAGNLWWHRPWQNGSAYFWDFSLPMTARGSYLEPSVSESLLEAPEGTFLTFSTSGAQPLFDNWVVLSARNIFTAEKTQKLALKLDTRTGLIRGSFVEPGPGARRLLEGVILHGVEALGFFPTTNTAGSWTIQAK